MRKDWSGPPVRVEQKFVWMYHTFAIKHHGHLGGWDP